MRPRSSLRDKVVLVTGAARGIGAATTRELATRGAHVIAVGLEPEYLEALTDELGPRHAWYEADVTDRAAVSDAVRAAVVRFGRIDACVANAGVVNYGTVQTADPDAFARTVEVNLVGVYRTLSAVVPYLIATRGHALLVGSIASLVPLPGAAAYAAAKAGVDALAATARLELAHAGVTVGCAYPGWIDTAMVRDAEEALPSFKQMRKRLPWPANTTSSPESCAIALAKGLERRSRKIYFPRSVVVIGALRPLLTSTVSEWIASKRTGEVLNGLDLDITRLQSVDPTTTDPVETGQGDVSHG